MSYLSLSNAFYRSQKIPPTNFLEFNASSVSLVKMKMFFLQMIVLEIQIVHSPVYYDYLNVDKILHI
jgi:hypothetical protein